METGPRLLNHWGLNISRARYTVGELLVASSSPVIRCRWELLPEVVAMEHAAIEKIAITVSHAARVDVHFMVYLTGFGR